MKSWTAGIALLAAAGCAHTGIQSTAPKKIAEVPTGRVEGPYVQADTRFDITLDDALGTIASVPGTRFTATVQQPLFDPSGRMVVPKGAKVVGHVVSVHQGDRPNIRVAFDEVDTLYGPAPLAARILTANQFAYLGPPEYVPGYGYSTLYPYWGPPYAYGYGYGYGYSPGFIYRPRELRVPRGATMTVLLTGPIFPPGTAVRRG